MRHEHRDQVHTRLRVAQERDAQRAEEWSIFLQNPHEALAVGGGEERDSEEQLRVRCDECTQQGRVL